MNQKPTKAHEARKYWKRISNRLSYQDALLEAKRVRQATNKPVRAYKVRSTDQYQLFTKYDE